jgi:hypothetical protein
MKTCCVIEILLKLYTFSIEYEAFHPSDGSPRKPNEPSDGVIL